MTNQRYFYHFLNPISRKLALLAQELENSIFTSPRTMLTHSRVFVETILHKVMKAEGLQVKERANLIDLISQLHEKGYVTQEICDALHDIRKIGNQAAHDSRKFRFSEALQSWEELYTIVRWYVEVYCSVDVAVPEYQDPELRQSNQYDITELEVRLRALEKRLVEETVEEKEDVNDKPYVEEEPGFTTIRTITYKDRKLEIPHFLRDAFLLPQRFGKSETFLIRLGAEQQARIISELPNDFEGLHKHVKRYNDKNDENFFEELKIYIEEEKVRRRITLERQGELFFFFKDKHIIVTEDLMKIPLTKEQFTGIPSLLRQLNDDLIDLVGQLPKELVILAKYDNVGIGTVEKLFEQLVDMQR